MCLLRNQKVGDTYGNQSGTLTGLFILQKIEGDSVWTHLSLGRNTKSFAEMEDEHKRISHRLGKLEETGPADRRINRQCAEPCPVCGTDGTEPSQAREPVGRTGKQGWRHLAKSKVVLINLGNRSSLWTSGCTDWIVERKRHMFKNCVLKVSVDTKKWLKAAGIRAVKTYGTDSRGSDWHRSSHFRSGLADGSIQCSSGRSGKCAYQCGRYSRGYGGQIKPSILLRRKAERKKLRA